MGLPLQGPPLFLPVSKSSATTFYEWPTSLDEGRGTQCQGGFDGGGVSGDIGVYVALVAGNDINVCGQQWGWSTGADVGGHWDVHSGEKVDSGNNSQSTNIDCC